MEKPSSRGGVRGDCKNHERREDETHDQPNNNDRDPLRPGEEPGPARHPEPLGPGPGITDHQRPDRGGKCGPHTPGRTHTGVVDKHPGVDRSLGVAVQERVKERPEDRDRTARPGERPVERVKGARRRNNNPGGEE